MRRILIASSLLLALSLAACGSEELEADPAVSTWGEGDEDDGFASALLEGTLAVERDCVYADQVETGEHFVLAFADGSASVDGDVLTYADQEVRSGDAVAAGGAQLGDDDVTLAEGCDESAPVWWVAPGASLLP